MLVVSAVFLWLGMRSCFGKPFVMPVRVLLVTIVFLGCELVLAVASSRLKFSYPEPELGLSFAWLLLCLYCWWHPQGNWMVSNITPVLLYETLVTAFKRHDVGLSEMIHEQRERFLMGQARVLTFQLSGSPGSVAVSLSQNGIAFRHVWLLRANVSGDARQVNAALSDFRRRLVGHRVSIRSAQGIGALLDGIWMLIVGFFALVVGIYVWVM